MTIDIRKNMSRDGMVHVVTYRLRKDDPSRNKQVKFQSLVIYSLEANMPIEAMMTDIARVSYMTRAGAIKGHHRLCIRYDAVGVTQEDLMDEDGNLTALKAAGKTNGYLAH